MWKNIAGREGENASIFFLFENIFVRFWQFMLSSVYKTEKSHSLSVLHRNGNLKICAASISILPNNKAE
jgi:hypothetical protein